MIKYGKFYSIQMNWNRLELGIHIEPFSKKTNSDIKYGPYIDLHLPFICLSFGLNPIYAGEIDLIKSYSRGGLNANI